jgi:hypothetical protein
MRLLAIILLGLSGLSACSHKEAASFYRPPAGFVPDEKTAVAIAKIVWAPIYGEKGIPDGEPYVAKLEGDVWYVFGTLPEGAQGGVMRAWIRKSDARVLGVDSQQ